MSTRATAQTLLLLILLVLLAMMLRGCAGEPDVRPVAIPADMESSIIVPAETTSSTTIDGDSAGTVIHQSAP